VYVIPIYLHIFVTRFTISAALPASFFLKRIIKCINYFRLNELSIFNNIKIQEKWTQVTRDTGQTYQLYNICIS